MSRYRVVLIEKSTGERSCSPVCKSKKDAITTAFYINSLNGVERAEVWDFNAKTDNRLKRIY